jgi:hypothetical protein
MTSGDSLALYRELIPGFAMPGKKYTDDDVAYMFLHELETISIFDCRALPTTFLDDTGDAVFDEIEQTKEQIYLPYNYCYFEFADEPKMIYAGGSFHYPAGSVDFETATSRSLISTDHVAEEDIGYEIEVYDLSLDATFNGACSALSFGNTIPNDDGSQQPFHTIINEDALTKRQRNKLKPDHWETASKRVLAVMMLLRDKLVIDRMKRDPAPRVSRERERTQKPPVSGDAHVLTINVPIVRYHAARNTPEGTHDSPALHWRRGHWRVYARGSNFEKTGWVNRCLVGDPDKGYRRVQYRLVHRPLKLIQGVVDEGWRRE